MSVLTPESGLPLCRRYDPYLSRRHLARNVCNYRTETHALLLEYLRPGSTLLPQPFGKRLLEITTKPMIIFMSGGGDFDRDRATLSAHFWEIFFRFFIHNYDINPAGPILVEQATRLVTHSEFSDMATSPSSLAELDECRNRK